MAVKNFKTNTNKSLISWTGRKITGRHTGTIHIADGSFDIDTRTIMVTDIEDAATRAQFAGHLFADDFFAVDKFPTANFTIVNATPLAANKFRIDGQLTIKGITHSLSFEATVYLQGNTVAATGEIVVDRTKYGMKFGSGNFFTGLGDSLIYNEFILDLDLVATLN